ncbi:MAG TPA: hypothetical protein VIT23_16735 [Terrimicrobiaceae bacterium]
MDIELGRTVVSAISALSEMVVAYRVRTESDKVITEQPVQPIGSAPDPWRLNTQNTFFSEEQLDQIVSSTEASPEAGKALASAVPEETLREILKHIDTETLRLRESIADRSLSKAHRQRDLDHAEAELCVELKAIKRSNKDVIPDVPMRALDKAWEQHRCS